MVMTAGSVNFSYARQHSLVDSSTGLQSFRGGPPNMPAELYQPPEHFHCMQKGLGCTFLNFIKVLVHLFAQNT